MTVVPLAREHWPEVERIYAAGIATGHATFESEPPTWEQFDAAKLPGLRLVAVEDGRPGHRCPAVHDQDPARRIPVQRCGDRRDVVLEGHVTRRVALREPGQGQGVDLVRLPAEDLGDLVPRPGAQPEPGNQNNLCRHRAILTSRAPTATAVSAAPSGGRRPSG